MWLMLTLLFAGLAVLTIEVWKDESDINHGIEHRFGHK